MKTNASPRAAWPLYLCMLLGAAVLGASIFGLVSNQKQTAPVAAPTAPPTSAETDSDDTNHEPPPMLTSGKTPAQAAVLLGNWYFDHKNWKKAIANYEQAIASGADNADVRTDLGSAYRFDGQLQKALETYQRAHKMDPRHEHSLFNQGGVYAFDLKDNAKAIAVWREYLKEFPNGENAARARELIEKAQNPSNAKP